MFGATLDDLSWEEIQQYARSGVAPNIFNVGDMKTNVTVNVHTLSATFSGGNTSNYTMSSTSQRTMNVVLVGFKENCPAFCTYGMGIYYPYGMSENTESYYETYSGYIRIRDYLAENGDKIIPDAYQYTKDYTYSTESNGYPVRPNPHLFTSGRFNSTSKLFIPSIGRGEFEYFTTNERNKLGTNSRWKTRNTDAVWVEDTATIFYDAVSSSGKRIPASITNGDYSECILLNNSSALPSPICFIIG